MNEQDKKISISRRRFIQIAALGVVGLAGAGALADYAPWMDMEEILEPVRRPLERNPLMQETMKELVRYATLAASGHNTQPWKFNLKNQEIEIWPDYERALPLVDAQQRELWISLGCALENLLLAARSVGLTGNVIYPQDDAPIRVLLQEGVSFQDELFEAIPRRQSTRSLYSGQPLASETLDALKMLALETGVALRFIEDDAEKEAIIEMVRLGNLEQYGERAFVDELVGWLRFNKKEAMKHQDGLYSACSGNPQVPRWLGSLFMYYSDAGRQADVDEEKLRSSSGLLVLTSETDDAAAWIRSGQVYERLALKMTALNICSALVNQPLEIPRLRQQLAGLIGAEDAKPQMLLRYGYATEMPFSLRRPLEEVMSFQGHA